MDRWNQSDQLRQLYRSSPAIRLRLWGRLGLSHRSCPGSLPDLAGPGDLAVLLHQQDRSGRSCLWRPADQYIPYCLLRRLHQSGLWGQWDQSGPSLLSLPAVLADHKVPGRPADLEGRISLPDQQGRSPSAGSIPVCMDQSTDTRIPSIQMTDSKNVHSCNPYHAFCISRDFLLPLSGSIQTM